MTVCRDPPAADEHVADLARPAAAVDNEAALDHDVAGHGLRAALRCGSTFDIGMTPEAANVASVYSYRLTRRGELIG
jgi:hypothetical protein